MTVSTLIGTAFAHHQAGAPQEAEPLYRQVLGIEPNNLNALQLLGALLLDSGRAGEAVALLEGARQALQAHGDARAEHAVLFCNLGAAHKAAGRTADAIATYRDGLAVAPGNVVLNERLAADLMALGRPAEAVAVYETLVAIRPDHSASHAALGRARLRLMQTGLAIESFRCHVQLAPHSAAAHFNLGRTLSLAGRHREACRAFEAAIRLDAAGALRHAAHILHAVALEHLGRPAESAAQYRLALAQQPVLTLPSATAGSKISVLFLMAPGLYNTPYEYLTQQADYDVHFVFLVPECHYDAAALRPYADLVVNLVSDAEHDGAVLPVAASLATRLARPTINHPDIVALTSRAALPAQLSGIAGCRAARISSHAGATLLAPGFLSRPDVPSLPFLVRRAGCHNGDAFEKIASETDLRRLAERDTSAIHHLIEYLDYRSGDGFFRKYRFFFVGDEILPYHLAISAEWKVHHVTTDMAEHPWMQQEEAAFLDAPGSVFGAAQMAALQAVRRAVGLDFFGIDCSIDQAGNVVVFEANATMRVHGDNPEFRYMDAAAHRIRTAFDRLIERTADRSRTLEARSVPASA